MKKTLLSLTLLLTSSIIANAQWTTNGTVTSTTNSVGISTTAPISRFQVNSTVNKFSVGSAFYQGLNYGTSYVGFNAARTTLTSSTDWTIDGDGYHNGGGVIYADIYGNIYLSPLGSTGTGSRTLTDLEVKNSIALRVGADGTVYAKKIMVSTTTFPDYVFKKDYRLLSLSEVKAYIDQHQHLPEIPSEQDIVKDGLNLAEMNKLLMKEVEELTLYLIDSEKRASLQQQQINELKDKMTALAEK
ncbi:hypothetical protein [Mucilaginibacter sp. SJ]|uniref:hypothetical protein n=1 Tax=Mucilaginibacter sp. SJ TaxID=3029053 RepID=UPI0023A9ACDC|nr:hypothetical protein [Mucilaginibacter sp. SJ]WEA00656.1 hypothetical protein MusilaSJ_24685 [Mucilaginibacter sp. SJ]